MKIEYEIEADVVGIINGEKYEIEDSSETLREWHKLQNDFSSQFNEFSCINYKDYEFAEWHYGIKCLNVSLHNEKFYTNELIPRILKVLRKNGDCFAQFECYRDNLRLIGNFQIYIGKVVFDKMLEGNGVINKLCSNRDGNMLLF